MNFLKTSIFITTFLFYSCSNFKAIVNKDGLIEVSAPSDHFVPYCEKVVKDDDSIAYGFMIFFLDEEKTVGAATGMLTTLNGCLKWKSEVLKILGIDQSIVLIGFGNIQKPRVEEEFFHTFEKHGTFQSNGRSFDFFSIRNNHGQCYAVFEERCQ